MTNDVKWTSKAPTLLIGIGLSVVGAVLFCWSKSRTMTIAAIFTFSLGGAFIYYSTTVKEWCVSKTRPELSADFAPSLRGCLRQKGWFEL